MNLTDLQVELRSIHDSVTKNADNVGKRLSALHLEIEKLKSHDTPKPDIEFVRITSEAAKKPLVRENLRAAQLTTKKAFFAALAYLIALDSENVEDKLYYLCRLAQGCDYPATAEDLCQMGLAYAPQDMDSLGQYLDDLKNLFMVEALVLVNIAGSASRVVLGALSTLADSLDIEAHKMRDLGQMAQVMLRSGKYFATIKQASFWAMLADCRVGDIFTFGSYPQCTNGALKPIEWQVLRRDNDGLLVISKYALDCKPYNVNSVDITWSQCTLRRWLNSEFLTKAFDEQERQWIKEVHVNNPNSHWNDVCGGPDTDDKVFLLSHDEAEQLFANNDARMCKPTDYAKKNNVYTDNGMCWWWLRSPGGRTDDAAYVYSDGGVYHHHVNYDYGAVRPAFKIAL